MNIYVGELLVYFRIVYIYTILFKLLQKITASEWLFECYSTDLALFLLEIYHTQAEGSGTCVKFSKEFAFKSEPVCVE